MSDRFFLDTNILIYSTLNIGDPREEAARSLLLRKGGVISIQVLNEFVNAVRQKLKFDWSTVDVALLYFGKLFPQPVPLTFSVHSGAIALAKTHKLSFYDALIVSSSIESGCSTLYSEDMQDGQIIGPLQIINPFSGPREI